MLRAVAVTTPDPSADELVGRIADADEIGEVIDVWLWLVGQWLEVLSGIDIGPGPGGGSHLVKPRYVHPLPIVADRRGGSRHYATMTQHGVAYRSHTYACRGDCERAVSHANADRTPPAEHLLLRDCRAAWRRHDRRKAVIDAATAAEVALAEAIRGRLDPNAGDTAVEQVLKNTSGVVELYDLAVGLGCSFPVSRGRVINELAGRRNLAVHARAVPDDDDLRSAHDVARALVDAVSVLP